MWHAYQIRNKRKKRLAGTPETKTPLERIVRRWEDSINTDLKKIFVWI
jgi:hypothetical protein